MSEEWICVLMWVLYKHLFYRLNSPGKGRRKYWRIGVPLRFSFIYWRVLSTQRHIVCWWKMWWKMQEVLSYGILQRSSAPFRSGNLAPRGFLNSRIETSAELLWELGPSWRQKGGSQPPFRCIGLWFRCVDPWFRCVSLWFRCVGPRFRCIGLRFRCVG